MTASDEVTSDEVDERCIGAETAADAETHRLPLVEGTSFTRGSASTAMRSARAERLERGLRLVVRVRALQVVHVQRDLRVIDEALEELVHQVDVELADAGARELDVELEAGPPGQVHHRARQRLVERHVGVPVAAHALLVADRLGERLAQRDADVLDGVVRVDVQVALRGDLDVERAVARDLLEHVIEKRHAGRHRRLAGAVEVELDADLRLVGVAGDFGFTHGHAGTWRGAGTERAGWSGGDGLGQCGEEGGVLVRRADGDPQAAVEQAMRSVETLDEHSALLQSVENALRVAGGSEQYKIGVARDTPLPRAAAPARESAVHAQA